MARDRQRAKQRRRRQGGAAPRGASRTTEARDIGLDDATADDAGLGEGTPAPDPLDHASADVDQARLAEAGATPPDAGSEDVGPGVYEDELEGDAGDDVVENDLLPAGGRERERDRAPRKRRGRLLTFLRHCVDELRRVQWPDRRQVGQGTAVTLGFVVIAGGYLGLLDAIWKPLIEAIL
jgi:preprotein translocase SecE subunit